MKTKFQAVCFFYFGLIYFLCQVSLFECQVVLVTRNVTDSFRIGQDGCKGNQSVCTDRASCQEDGSCLCKKDYPNFRNPTIIKRNGTVQYGDSYGCMDNTFILLKIGAISCMFTPYQVIPNDHQEPATKFTNGLNPKSCEYISADARYPTNITQDLTWLNKTYIEFNNSGDNRTWYFKWKNSVPKLEGLIVTIVFRCMLPRSASSEECLQAKVFGTWPSPSPSVNPQPTTSSQISASHPPTKSSSTIATGTVTSANPSKPSNSPSKDDKPNTIIITVAVVASLVVVVVIIIILVVCCLLKRKKNRKTIYKHSTYQCSYDNGHVNRGSGSDTADTTAEQTTSVKSLTSEYETPDVNIDRNKANGGSGAASTTPADQTTPVKILNSEYATPDVNIDRNKVNGDSGDTADTAADQTTPVKILNSEYATPDDGIERIEVNGDMYAVVSIKRKKTSEKNNNKPNEVHYMDPEKLALDVVKDEEQSSQPTEYAEISGFIQRFDE